MLDPKGRSFSLCFRFSIIKSTDLAKLGANILFGNLIFITIGFFEKISALLDMPFVIRLLLDFGKILVPHRNNEYHTRCGWEGG